MTEQERELLLTTARIMRNNLNEANLNETRDPAVLEAHGISPEAMREDMISRRAYYVRELDAVIRPFVGRSAVNEVAA